MTRGARSLIGSTLFEFTRAGLDGTTHRRSFLVRIPRGIPKNGRTSPKIITKLRYCNSNSRLTRNLTEYISEVKNFDIPNQKHSDMSLDKTQDPSLFSNFLTRLYSSISEVLPQGAPTAPVDAVTALIQEMGLSQSDVANIHRTFERLRILDGRVLLAGQRVLSSKSVIKAIAQHKDYVELLLQNILQLGGCYETVDWDRFLYVFLKFCALTRVELCQLLFLIIIRELRGLEIHYLTSTQLDRFYERYRTQSTPTSMNCSKIHFSNFPLARYYATDFIEVCFLYSPLINPMLVLQRQFQSIMPSLRFWDNYDFLSGMNRKITHDFFLMRRTRIEMTSAAAFQETCDMLLMRSELLNRETSRWVELDFLTAKRRMTAQENVTIENVYSKMPQEGIIRKNSDIGKPV